MNQNRILVDEWRVEIPWHKRQERVPQKVHFRMVACGDSSGKRAAGADLDHLTNSLLPTTIGSGSYSSVRNAVYNVTVAGCRESAMTMTMKRNGWKLCATATATVDHIWESRMSVPFVRECVRNPETPRYVGVTQEYPQFAIGHYSVSYVFVILLEKIETFCLRYFGQPTVSTNNGHLQHF